MIKRLLLPLLAVCLVAGCSQPNVGDADATTTTPSGSQTADELKTRMNDAFAGLEMYASDHSMAYPDNLDTLIPKYLDEVPIDPVSKKPIVFEKTERGFLLSASGDYSGMGAEEGFPKMNQDGFYVMKDSEFPQEP